MPKPEKRRRQKEGRRARMEDELKNMRARRRQRLGINLVVLALLSGVIAVLVVRSREERKQGTDQPTPTPAAQPVGSFKCEKPKKPNRGPFSEPPPQTVDPKKKYLGTIKTSLGTIKVEMDSQKAPVTVNSVAFLACRGFYDGLIIHRIERDFVIQGGDPKGNGSGGPGYQVVEAPPGELKYDLGVVAMAKTATDPKGASGSQLFIVSGSKGATLTPDYALLGKVVSGLGVVRKIEATCEKPSCQKSDGTLEEPAVRILSFTVEES